MTSQLPPSYWISQIRADLARRREAGDDLGDENVASRATDAAEEPA